jgi:hypothetical protein
MQSSLVDFARRGKVIVMAGAGVSAVKPSALPGWKPMNAAIAQALARRLESSIDRQGWLSRLLPIIDAERAVDRFPPDYQAQLIAEMSGDRYFRALQAFDVDVINAAHDGISALAAAGALKAVVTTNFDRLIERSLERRGVPYIVAYDAAGYGRLLERLRMDGGPLPIVKIHGSVSDHLSMVDTLKQRKQGRSQQLQGCLDALQSGYWLYLGFSADDLESDSRYLGLVAGARDSAGATYVAYPGSPGLRKGAQILMNAYTERGHTVIAHLGPYLAETCRALGVPEPDPIPEDTALGLVQFQEKLGAWANELSPAAAGLCLAAILEAIGQAEPAVRILDRLVRKELYEERDTADFHALQLHYGRLGAAWGRFIAVPDLGGASSNASVETSQSLLRLLHNELGFAAASWLACLWLWMNDGQTATSIALDLLRGLRDGWVGRIKPRTDEEVVDAWLSAAQVCLLNSHPETISLAVSTAEAALDRSKRSGDVVRAARVAAVRCLALAETSEDVPALLEQYKDKFADAQRVGDGFALGMRSLALGRWCVGPGGLAMARATALEPIAQRALAHLGEALGHFRNQGMEPWALFALLQRAKAHADLRQFDEAQDCINVVGEGLKRFPILASHCYEVVGQVRSMRRDPDAAESFQAAVDAAEESGLLARREWLMQLMQHVSRADPPAKA